MSSDRGVCRNGDDTDDSVGVDTYERAYDSSEDGIEPDLQLEDTDIVECFRDLDKEISNLIKAEPVSEPSFGLASPPASEIIMQKIWWMYTLITGVGSSYWTGIEYRSPT